MISGFSIDRATALAAAATGEQRCGSLAFWKRRFWRQVPTSLAAILFSLLLSRWIDRTLATDGAWFSGDLVTPLLLVHNPTNENNTGLGNMVSWSLVMKKLFSGQ
ncbi:MAG: hypothetical protein ACK46L_16575 [Synechococcaceae cyanobacterium]